MIITHNASASSMVETAVSVKTEAMKAASPAADEVTKETSSTVSSSSDSCEALSPKPFFIMDWLEDIDPKDLELAQKMLKTPDRVVVPPKPACEVHPSPKVLFETTSPSKKQKEAVNSFKKRGIAIGNGYNAKGLQKAKKGAWEEALCCWENALEIRTQVLGETHVDVANTYNNIGIALGKLNRPQEAIENLQRALEIRTQHYGRTHSEVAATLHNMGNVFQQCGDFESAVNYFCETKILQETLYGTSHVQVARACVAMGHTYFQAGEFLDAREAYFDALAIFERAGLSQANVEVQNTITDIQEIDRCLRRAH